MQHLVPYLSATATILGILFFLGIVWWAWLPNNQPALHESAQLPFDLPDEFMKEQS